VIFFLPPAPHTAAFFDTITDELGVGSAALTYPGYGGQSAINNPGIASYAKAQLEHFDELEKVNLVGFHTGCLVGAELSKMLGDKCGRLILIDVPNFDAATREKYAAGMDKSDPQNAAFFAAFAYDCTVHFPSVTAPTTIIATQSFLFEPSQRAVELISHCDFVERRDISKPVFEAHTRAIADEILKAAGK